MAGEGRRKAADIKLDELARLPRPKGIGKVFARVPRRRLMSVEERLRFFDDIRSRSKPTDEDSTEIIRRDRDER